MDATQKQPKKKNPKFFENYILKLMNFHHTKNDITSDSKQQLNSVIYTITKIISVAARDMTEFSKKKTISIDEVHSAINTLFSKNIANKMCVAAIAANSTYLTSDSDKTLSSKQVRAGIFVPPSLVEKFLRDFGNSKIQVTASAPVYFAGAIQELILTILNLAVDNASASKHIRVTVRDIEVSIREDKDLSSFFHKHNILFLGGGSAPHIHDALLVKRPRKRSGKPRTKTNHRFRPGTVSLREIKKAQNSSNTLTFPKSTFEKIVRDKLTKHNDPEGGGIMIRKDVFHILQFFIEQKVVNLLKNANFAAVHANRLKVIPEDIDFVNNILNGVAHIVVDQEKVDCNEESGRMAEEGEEQTDEGDDYDEEGEELTDEGDEDDQEGEELTDEDDEDGEEGKEKLVEDGEVFHECNATTN